MLEELITDPEWDKPFFKILAHNDTSAAPGHQGGIVIPKEIRVFLPGLSSEATPDNPTVDSQIVAELVVEGNTIDKVATRYQYQTWGGTRSPESRLTGNLGRIRDTAEGGDCVVFQRSQQDINLYRLILVKKDSEDHRRISKIHGNNRWGLLTDERPLSESDMAASRKRQVQHEKNPFSLFDQDARVVVDKTTRLARSVVFRRSLLELYGSSCVVCRQGLRIGGLFEVEAAHIVPRHKFGCDDARNGLALCKSHHWAFDVGLIGVDSDYRIIVPGIALEVEENEPLEVFRGVELLEPTDEALAPRPEALEWHRDNTLLKS